MGALQGSLLHWVPGAWAPLYPFPGVQTRQRILGGGQGGGTVGSPRLAGMWAGRGCWGSPVPTPYQGQLGSGRTLQGHRPGGLSCSSPQSPPGQRRTGAVVLRAPQGCQTSLGPQPSRRPPDMLPRAPLTLSVCHFVTDGPPPRHLPPPSYSPISFLLFSHLSSADLGRVLPSLDFSFWDHPMVWTPPVGGLSDWEDPVQGAGCIQACGHSPPSLAPLLS